MLSAVQSHYRRELQEVECILIRQVDDWDWCHIPAMRPRILGFVGRSGKRLRPLLTILAADLYAGCLDRVLHPAAAIELYHTASLIYDDIQDNSEFRRGLPCAHVTASTSMAMNQGGIVRAFVHLVVHRSPGLLPAERLEVMRLIDTATANVVAGQIIDIGWHEGWYPSYRDLPYGPMIAGKTGALFGCAASLGAYLAGAPSVSVGQMGQLGTAIGVLFQQIDDYLDVFGDPIKLRRPRYDDFREGKLTHPLLRYFDQIGHQPDEVDSVLACLAKRDTTQTDWDWLAERLRKTGVETILAEEFRETGARLCDELATLGTNRDARLHLQSLVRWLSTSPAAHRAPAATAAACASIST